MSSKGNLIVISGFSGVGKGTVIKNLLKCSDHYVVSVSATTREPREEEKHGVHYYFLTEKEFSEMIRKNELIEFAVYCDHYYGTPRRFVEEQLDLGNNVILEIEVQGARKIRELYPDALLIFIMPPSGQELMNRLAERGSETKRVIWQRLNRAEKESESIEDYDFVFINDVAEDCAERIHRLIEAADSRTTRNVEIIDRIRTDIHEFLKGE